MNGFKRSEFYGRMFPRTAFPVGPQQEEDLKNLGKAMRDIRQVPGRTPNAGFTYFGQFIDHDLTYDNTELERRDVEPGEIRNFRTPKLDLELIYGRGPKDQPELYENDGASLRVDAAVDDTAEDKRGSLRDIGRYDDGTPRHADPEDTRNLENFLVMQIHVLFMRFHNEAVRQCNGAAFQNLGLSGGTFERAQQLVRWHYQWLVREIFLREIVLGRILKLVWDPTKPKIPWHEPGFFLPAEFSLVAFRFGHSMVRAQYRINCRRPGVPLADLMTDGNPARLTEDSLIEWGLLFRRLLLSGSTTIPSEPINTGIAEPLHHLPEYTKRQHSDKSVEPQPKQLPARTLLRGARAHLPSGQEVAAYLVAQGVLSSNDVLTPQQIVAPVTGMTSDDSGNMLQGTWMVEHTPLYYYLLKEAEVLTDGNHFLGPMGGRIIAEVIERVLLEDDKSYLKVHGPGWTPPAVWEFKDGGSPAAVNSFQSLIQMIGDELPHGCSPAFASRFNAGLARFGRRFYAFIQAFQ